MWTIRRTQDAFDVTIAFTFTAKLGNGNRGIVFPGGRQYNRPVVPPTPKPFGSFSLCITFCFSCGLPGLLVSSLSISPAFPLGCFFQFFRAYVPAISETSQIPAVFSSGLNCPFHIPLCLDCLVCGESGWSILTDTRFSYNSSLMFGSPSRFALGKSSLKQK